MAKVVLVWNEHPTEVVAGFHARKVATILRKKYGHEVVMEKIPVKETVHGILRRESTKIAVKKLIEARDSEEFAREAVLKHKTCAFNFHASDEKIMGQAINRKPSDFRIGEFSLSDTRNNTEITLNRYPNQKHYIVEMPGIYFPLKTKLRKAQEKRRNAALKANKRTVPFWFRAEQALRQNYHLNRMPLAHKKQQKYLHPAISEKIAAAISKIISR